MIAQLNTKIFIDTNIFLGLYNSNDAGNVKAFMRSLFKNKNVLITTEQSVNEYLRNRARIINEFKSTFVDTAATAHTSSFISSFAEYKDYLKCAKELKSLRKKVIGKIDAVLSNTKQDYIYESFMKLWKANNIILTTDSNISLATIRKTLGNPPGGDKYSSGDEVIWETLVNTLKCNLIVVSKDRTYTQNKEFLQYEYNKKQGLNLQFVIPYPRRFPFLALKWSKAQWTQRIIFDGLILSFKHSSSLGVKRRYRIFMMSAETWLPYFTQTNLAIPQLKAQSAEQSTSTRVM